MTISSATVRASYAGNGSTSVFSTSFVFADNDHVAVSKIVDATGIKTDWTEGTQYTLTGAGTGAAGAVTVSVSPDYRPASGETLVIVLDIPNIQETDFPTGGQFPSAAVEAAFDLAAQRDAKNAFDITRTLHAPDTDDSDLDMELPTAANRASSYLFFDADGEPTAVNNVDPGSVSISSFAETFLDDTTAAAVRTTLGLGTAAIVATGTSGATIPLLNANNTFSGNNTNSGTETFSGNVTASKQVLFSGTISPTALAADTNDYAPTGGTTSLIWRLTSDSTVRTITGITGGAAGRILVIINDNAATVMALEDESASSTAANRLALNGVTNIAPQQSVTLIYDGTDSRWRCIGRGWTHAAQSAMEAASTNSVVVTPANAHYHPGHPKFWNMVTVSGGTPTSAASYNLTSITDTATGQLTNTIATDFSSANWKADTACEQTSTTLTAAGGNVERSFIAFGGQAAGTLQVDGSDFTATTHVRRDPTAWHLGGSGDQ